MIAQKVEELSPEQMLAIAPYILQPKHPSLKLKVLELLIVPELLPYLQYATEDEAHALSNLAEWVWDIDFSEAPIKSFQINNENWVMPNPRLTRTVFVEYIYTEGYIEKFSDNPNEEILNKLCSVICRPQRNDLFAVQIDPDWNGDERTKFSPVLSEQYQIAWSNQPYNWKAYVLLYYLSSRSKIINQYKNLFKSDKSTIIQYGWTGALFDVAEQGTFGNFVCVQYENLHNILYYLSKKVAENHELKLRLKRQQ